MTPLDRVCKIKNSKTKDAKKYPGFSQKRMFIALGIDITLGNRALHWTGKKPPHIIGILSAVKKYLDDLQN